MYLALYKWEIWLETLSKHERFLECESCTGGIVVYIWRVKIVLNKRR